MEDKNSFPILVSSNSLERVRNSIEITNKLILEKATGDRIKAEYYYNLGYNNGDDEEELVLFTKAIELDPDFTAAYHSLGMVKWRLKNYEGALQDFTKAIEILPLDLGAFGAYSVRSLLRRELKDFLGEIEDITKLIEIDPNNPYSFQTRAQAKREIGDFIGAESDLKTYQELLDRL